MMSPNEINDRFGYHRATKETAPQHNKVRQVLRETAHWINENIPDSRDKSLSLTALQECMHWANSAIAMTNEVDYDTPDLPNV